MDKTDVGVTAFLIGFIAATIVLVLITVFNYESHDHIIKHGCGEYNQTDGKWQWKEAK